MNIEQLFGENMLPARYAEQFAHELAVSPSEQLPDEKIEMLFALAVKSAFEEGEVHGSTDNLTGLLGRKAFATEISASQARFNRDGIPFGLGAFDLDNLKQVNDEHGHKMGDRYIVAGVTGLKKAIARSADSLFRIGAGDEFASILHNVHEEGLRVVGDRVQEATQDEFNKLGITDIPLHISAGYVLAKAGVSIADMEVAADQRMYEMKQKTRPRKARKIAHVSLFGWHRGSAKLTLNYEPRQD